MNTRRYFGYLVSFSLFLGVFSSSTATALGSIGQWDFCTPGQTKSCITKIIVSSPEGAETMITTTEAARAASVEYRVSCGPVECDGSPTMKQLQSHVASGCKSDLGLGLNRPWLVLSAGVKDHPTWRISIEVNTGTFDPVFALGKGTLKTQRTENPDGSFSFTWTAKPVIVANVSLSTSIGNPSTNSRYADDIKEFYSNAVATSVEYSASINVLPATHFLLGNCVLLPITGGWAEANATGFSFGADFSKIGTDPTKQVFPFSAYAAHFIPGEWMSNIPLGPVAYSPIPAAPTSEANRVVNSARVQMYLPSDYLRMLGYDDLATFTTSSFSVAVEDGQELTPSLVIQDGGVLLDLGIRHYSAPNPSLSLVFRQKANPPSNPASIPAIHVFALAVKQPRSAKTLANYANLVVASNSKVLMRVAAGSVGFCRVVGASLKGLKNGSCRVTITVAPRNGKATSRTITLRVEK